MTTARPLALLGAAAALACVPTLARAHQSQCPPTRIVSPEGADADRFGGPIFSNAKQGGSQWVIGETNQVWAYEMVDGRLVYRQELRSPHASPSHLFGTTLAMEGDRLVVGAYRVWWPGRDDPVGGAFLYRLVNGLWQYEADLEPPKNMQGSAVGSIVAMDGDVIFAGGGPRNDVIIYAQTPGEPGSWSARQIIAGDPDTWSGFPLVAGDGWLFIGASRDDTLARYGGSVSVYRRQDDGAYQLVQKIDGPALTAYDVLGFGAAMDFDGRTLAIGAGGASAEVFAQGAVFIFELEGDTWTHRQTLTHGGAKEEHLLGDYSVRVAGDQLVALAHGDSTPGADAVAYAYQRTAAGFWRQRARLIPRPAYRARHYFNLEIGNEHVLAGARREQLERHGPTTGAAYLFDLSCYECPDLDGDDVLTVFDYLEFLRAFQAGEPIADFDNDGELTVADFLAFQGAFAVGCP